MQSMAADTSSTIVVNHNAGFFSCCSVRLSQIVRYFNEGGRFRIPACVDSSNQFRWYKPPQALKKDITFEYFTHYDEDMKHSIQFPKQRITSDHHDQYRRYSTLPYHHLKPFIDTYFSLALPIRDLVKTLEHKYGLVYDDICVLFYRGNDKAKETKLCSYEEMVHHARQIIVKHPRARILIQSDETEFLEYVSSVFPNNAFYFKDEIRHMHRNPSTTVDKTMKHDIEYFSKYYLAITWVMSQCKWIVCTSGNCSLFIMYYRGHSQGVYQFLDGRWYLPT